MRIALDAMGADKGLDVTVDGAIQASRDYGHSVILVGAEDQIKQRLADVDQSSISISVVNAPDVIGMGEHPVKAVRSRPGASIVVACELVANGQADAVVSMGNTGASMAAALLKIRRIKGVERPAIAIPLPTAKGMTLLLDAGANADCRPNHLLQFAVMGSIYYSTLAGIQSPTVGLLNVGEEEEKGNELAQEVHRMLKASDLNFIGNVEGKDLPMGMANVVVCDGFVGNIVLKLAEGMGSFLLGMIKEEITKTPVTRIGALLAKPAFAAVKRRMDYSEYGGALLVGVAGVTIIGHGRSDAKAVRNAIKAAGRAVENGIVEKIGRRIGSLGE